MLNIFKIILKVNIYNFKKHSKKILIYRLIRIYQIWTLFLNREVKLHAFSHNTIHNGSRTMMMLLSFDAYISTIWTHNVYILFNLHLHAIFIFFVNFTDPDGLWNVTAN